jgi:hypothetical protein
MLRPAALVRDDVSEELSASIIGVTGIDSPILGTLMMKELRFSETSVPTTATSKKTALFRALSHVT